MASCKLPRASMFASPIVRPHILIAYADMLSSEEDSSFLPLKVSYRPCAQE